MSPECRKANQTIIERWKMPQFNVSELRTFSRSFRNPAVRTLLIAGFCVSSAVFLTSVRAESPTPDNPVYSIYDDTIMSLFRDNTTISQTGSGRPMGTIFISINGPVDNFQPNEDKKWYPEIAQGEDIGILIAGQVIAPKKDKYAIITIVDDIMPGVGHLKGGEMVAASSPRDLTKRMRITDEGLPDRMYGDPLSSYRLVTDARGDYLEAGVKGASDPAQNGKYILRLNNLFYPVGKWLKEVYYLYLPIVLNKLPG